MYANDSGSQVHSSLSDGEAQHQLLLAILNRHSRCLHTGTTACANEYSAGKAVNTNEKLHVVTLIL